MKVKERISREELTRLNQDQLECFTDHMDAYPEDIRKEHIQYEKNIAHILASMMQMCRGGERGTVLDVGCGPCYNSKILVDLLCISDEHYYGIDPLPIPIEKSGRRVFKGYIEDFQNYLDWNFEYTFASHSMEHCQDPVEAAMAVIRVTQLHGIIGQVTPAEEDDSPQHRNFLTLDEWSDLYGRLGAKTLLRFVADPGEGFPSVGRTPFSYLIMRREE